MALPRATIRTIALALCGLSLAGCHYGAPPDPNDPADVGVMTAETVRRNLRWANLMLQDRENNGQITATDHRTYIAERAQELISDLDIKKVPDSEAWAYAEIFMTAEDWPTAKLFLQKALKKPINEDRRVNDSLRMAETEGHLGNVAHSIELAKSVLNTPDNEGAPILTAFYLVLAPLLRGKGHDEELAGMLLDAVKVEERTKVDPQSDSGAAFLVAKPHHIHKALELASNLYEDSGHPDLGKKAADVWVQFQATEEPGQVSL
jgi:hypothetical protein